MSSEANLQRALCSAQKKIDRMQIALVDIATTSKGYPNASREGELALAVLKSEFGLTPDDVSNLCGKPRK